MNVLESGIKTAEAYHRQAKVAFDEGLISRSDLMSASVFELELRSRLLHTKNEFDNLTEQMLLLIGLPANTKLELTDALETDKSAQKNITASPLGLNNAYLRAIGYQVDAAEYMQQAARNAWLPRVNVFGSYELNDRKVFGFSSDAYMVGAQFSWTLFSGLQRSGALREANAQRRTAEVMLENTRREFAMQLEQAHRNLEHAALQIELTKAMIEQAQEDTRIRENRYKQGMEKTTDLLQAETRLLEARLNHYMALFQQRMSLAAIQMIIE
jgi:outer membrane protein TolC